MADLRTLDALSAYNKTGNLSGNYAADLTTQQTGCADFTRMVEEALGNTINKLDTVETKIAGSITGDVSMEELAIAVANAEMSLKTVVAIRDKLITAFQEIIRMPI